MTPKSKTDSYGDPLNDWSDPVYTLIKGGEIQTRLTQDTDQANSSSTIRNGTLIVTSTDLTLLRQLTPDSRVREGADGGPVWRISGQPNIKTGRMLGNTHLTATLTRTTVEAPNG